MRLIQWILKQFRQSESIRFGTINELTGNGLEYLLDVPTRLTVIAIFYNGSLVNQSSIDIDVTERTIAQ